MITTILGIVVIIVLVLGYLSIGAFLGSFAVDDPSTPIIFGYLVALFWPLWIIGLVAWAVIWGVIRIIYKAFLIFICGIWIERDISGNKRVRKMKDAVYIRYSYGTFIDFKPDIEERLEEYYRDLKYTNEDSVGRFFVDLMKYSNGRISKEEMLKKHSKTCTNLKKVLKYNWNIKDVPGL